MQPQGSIFNTDHINALVDRINATQQCGELQELVNEVYASMQAQLDAIGAQLAALQPLLDLLKVPTSLDAIISWLRNFITAFLGPYVAAYAKYAAQLAAVIIAIEQLTAAIEAAARRLTTCSIAVPSLNKPPMPHLPPPESL